jgi:GT2 family glycosyltransferase
MLPDRILTIGVTTRNRPQSLARCLTSLEPLDHLIAEIIVVDDAGDVNLEQTLIGLPPGLRRKVSIVRQESTRGYIAGRNSIVGAAASPYVLQMDDDAYVIDPGAVCRALELMAAHDRVAAVAYAQAEADGSPWPASMQPSTVSYRCQVPAYIGFAVLLRRTTFLELGGYRESFFFYGEEKDLCMRVLEAGHQVVYLPDALVAHVPDPSGRSQSRYLRYVIRNDCLCALYNEPLPMALLSVPVRLVRYVSMRRHGGSAFDPDDLRWIVSELVAAIPNIWRTRTPMRWTSIRRWRSLRQAPPLFEM